MPEVIRQEETDGDLLAQQAYEELDAEKEGREPKDLLSKPEEEEKEASETPADPNEPEIELVGRPDEEESEEEETGEEEPKPEEEGEENPETTDSEDAEITKHAEKHSMTYAEAKEDIEKTAKILEQFKDDPKEMARALRNKDREYDKLKNEIEKKTQEKPQVFHRLTEEQFKSVATKKVEENPDKYLDMFKSKFPKKAELLTDDAIIEEMIDKEWGMYQGFAEQEEKKLSNKAIQTREKILSGVPKEDKRFIPEVKAFVEQLTDQDLLNPEFDPSYLLHLAKGKRFDAEIKAAEERGYKRALEGAKILGVKGFSGKGSHKANSGVSGLNNAQKTRAEEMFPLDDGYTEEQAHEMFKDTYKDELKENPNYI